MELPIVTFWLLSANIDRITAQKDMRSLSVAVCSMGGEVVQKTHDRLTLEIGEVVRLEFNPMKAQRDMAGFEELRSMANN